jgi:hypothetical protein
VSSPSPALASSPGLDPESEEADETLSVAVPERIRRVVGGKAMVVKADTAPPAHDLEATTGTEAQTDFTSHIALRIGHER